jgi:putative acetyltransferase
VTVVRDYERGDAEGICRLFYETVRTVNLGDYSPEQVRAWAPNVPDPVAWHERMSGRQTLVADEGGEVVGFAELEEDGHLDMLYCRPDAVGRGVGSLLYAGRSRSGRAVSVPAGSLPRPASRPGRSSSGTGSRFCGGTPYCGKAPG